MHLRSSIHAYHFNHISIWDCKERESSWVMKLDKVRAEEQELRERDWWNRKRECLHPKKISSMSSKDGQWKENQGVGAWSRLLPHESEASRIFDMKDHVWMLWSKEESSKRCVLPTAFVPRFTALVPLC